MFAQPVEGLTPHNLWMAWNFEPSVLAVIGLTAVAYVWGMWNLGRRAGMGRKAALRRWGNFVGAMLALLIAFISPLDALSGDLFWAHMVQHLILGVVAAPLLILSDLPLVLLWALPRRWAQALGHGLNGSRGLSSVWRVLRHPVSAWLLFAIPLWVWHASTLYEAALHNETIHTFEHISFLASGMLFWWVLFQHTAADHLHYGMAIAYLFTTMLHSTVLGALMTFTSEPWYKYYVPLVGAWGMTPLQDQQLAGLIMWVPGGVVFTILTIGYFAAWFRALERRSARLQRRDELRSPHEPQ